MHGNAIVESSGLAVEDPEISEVLDVDVGGYHSAAEVIGSDRASVVRKRMEVSQRVRTNPRYLCSFCLKPVYLVSELNGQRFHFRHLPGDGDCRARTSLGESLSQIAARKYHGLQESEPHRRLKIWLQESLSSDPAFTDVQTETVWKSADGQSWRKPDVRASYKGIPVAFEIQLSTTFLKVISERRNFYLSEGGLLFWVFAHFDEGPRRLTQDDVFFNNNQNAFVINATTLALSKQRNQLHLECVWAEPTEQSATCKLTRRMVSFSELTLELERQRAYFFDFDGRQEELNARARASFEAFWLDETCHPVEVRHAAWQRVRAELARRGVQTPVYESRLPEALLNGLYSAKHGRCVGWRFRSFIEVAHRMASHPRFLRYFREALTVHRRHDLLRTGDHTGKWKAKYTKYRDALNRNDPEYEADRECAPLVRLLFPELNLERVFARAPNYSPIS